MRSYSRIWQAAALLALAVGCAKQPDESEFKTYSELENQSARPTTGAQDQERKPESAEPLGRASVSVSPDSSDEPAVAESTRRPASAKAEVSTSPPTVDRQLAMTVAGLPPAVAEKQPTEPLEIKLLIPEKTFETVGPEGALRVSYDDVDLLKVLNMEPVPVNCADYFPEWLKALDGQRIRIRGFMYPPFQETDLPFFVLARDNNICCFGRDPKRYDVIDVFMRDGVTTDYIQNRPFDVVGIFRIRPEASRGLLYQLYLIEDAVVIQ